SSDAMMQQPYMPPMMVSNAGYARQSSPLMTYGQLSPSMTARRSVSMGPVRIIHSPQQMPLQAAGGVYSAASFSPQRQPLQQPQAALQPPPPPRLTEEEYSPWGEAVG
ncbi:unnamed protein product, partial [Polarella glacialis]